jgi:uncharacterized RDD family membrane protein YckC
MTFHSRSALLAALLALGLATSALRPSPVVAAGSAASASQPVPAPSSAAAASAPDADATDSDRDDDDAEVTRTWDSNSRRWARFGLRHRIRHNGNDLVSIGHDATLPTGAERDSVVAVFGSATNNGTAHQDVVSVFGDTTVTGPTGGSAVAVMGNDSVNADVGGDVVAVLGNVTLGPAAHVHGHVVSILGTVSQDAAAVVDQGVERVFPEHFGTAEGLRRWVEQGLLWGRPLMFASGLQWLWGISFALLAIYALLALLFRDAAEHCIATLNDNPGKSLITAILAVMLTPLMLFLLAITVVGLLVIPIALVMLFIAAIFGKTTVLGWIGGRCLGWRSGSAVPHPALAVVVGGLIVMLAYLVPVLGFVVYILLGMIGYGAVLYAVLIRVRHHTSAGGPAPSGGPAPDAAAASAAAAAAEGAATPAQEAQASPGGGAPGGAAPLSTLPRAGFWIRMGALLIDAVIVWAVIHLLLDWPRDGSNRIGLIALAAYGAVMWHVKGTTIGGIACNLRVVRLDSRPLDWPTAWVRALGCILSLCALGLGFIWIAVDAGKQAWHDKLAGTIVVHVPHGTPLV